MSPRTGRPTDNPKKERLGIRVAEDQLKKLEICCQKTGLSKIGRASCRERVCQYV